ncbi:MAG TPA: hypothetical protein VFQ45_20635 [Longimicrobium sp.]|nr:hypothetical protein [Longimicrobium sp.]
MDDTLPTCRTASECDARDGQRIAVVGRYRFYPDLPGFDYSEAPRAVRIELADGLGPFLDPFWSPRAIRPRAEIDRYLGREVRVVGLYHRDMPRNPDDPPYASAMGGPCIEVESIEPAD